MKKDTLINTQTELKKSQFIENKIDGLLTKKILADKLKYSVSYINKLMRQCKIPYLKIGKSVRFKFGDVMAALEKESAV